MPTCINHPHRETRNRCFKDEVYLCEACLKCRSPELYCKHRSACPIWFQERKGFKDDPQPIADAQPDPLGLRN